MNKYKIDLTEAYNFFNKELFEGKLESCVISMESRRGVLGFYINKRFKDLTDDDTKIDLISLNFDHLDRGEKEVLSTLVHEMIHKWQWNFANPSRTGYHNREWAEKMKSVGLQPTHDGTPNGKETGQKMTHIIVAGDIFDLLADKYLASGFKIDWSGSQLSRISKPRTKSKFKYECPTCSMRAWAKKDSKLMCGSCEEHMEMEEE